MANYGLHPLVSILVPVYNASTYLQQCLKALCNQTLKNIEIIAINDGSTDDSLEILRAWADLDERIRIIDKTNSGYGASMNRGLQEATGMYIGIVEPDDYPDLAMFGKLAHVADRTYADLVKCNYYLHYEDHEDIVWNLHGFGYNKVFDPAAKPEIITRVPSIWAALYRRSFLLREGITFRETPGASFQDTSFCLKALFATKRMVTVRRPLLHYRMDNPGSSSKTTDKVYVVCDEMAEAESFLHERPDRARAFDPWLPVCKWGKYRWNYERIDRSVRAEFMERVHDEYQAAQTDGTLDYMLFQPNSRAQVRYLLEAGVSAFLNRYPESFPLDFEHDSEVSGDVGSVDRQPGETKPQSQDAKSVFGNPFPAVTVIVPVYNTKPYIRECIESLKNQTFGDFEAFIIDDASTDGSFDEAKACTAGDDRFTVWTRAVDDGLTAMRNEGPSATRNEGLDRARGEYIVFLDSDDYFTADALEKLICRARSQQLDELYYSGVSFVDGDIREGYQEDFGSRDSFEGVATGRQLFVFFEERDQFYTQGAMRMVRRGLIEDNGIRFKEGILHEDILFTFQALVAAQRSSFLNEPLYQRRLHSDSIMGKQRSIANVEGHFVSLQAIKQWLYEHIDDCDDAFVAALAKRMATWREMTAHDWNTCIAPDDRERYLESLSATDRVDFIIDIIGSGLASDRVREEYRNSRAYQVGSALAAGPRILRDKARAIADSVKDRG